MAFDLTGLSGYALEYAKAANAGASEDEAHRTATRVVGGSGLTRSDIEKIGTGLNTRQNITYNDRGFARNRYEDDEDEEEERLIRRSSRSSGDDFYDSLKDLMGENDYTFDAPSEEEMEGWASSYADASVNPLLSAIQTRLTKELAAQENAKREVEAAYAGLPEKFQARLGEARNYALENAIARGMGRSGVVNWETEKRTTPIMQEQAQADREKAAKMTAIANAIAAANTTAAEQTQSVEEQRGKLSAARLGELRQWAKQMAAAASSNNMNNLFNMANLYNNSQNTSSNMLMQMLPLLMGGE